MHGSISAFLFNQSAQPFGYLFKLTDLILIVIYLQSHVL